MDDQKDMPKKMPKADSSLMTIPLSEQSPVAIHPDEWPIVARASSSQGVLFVRQKLTPPGATTQTLVNGHDAQGKHVGGFLVDKDASSDESVRAIRRVGGLLGSVQLAQHVIRNLPPRRI